jgi:hypothetical protein
LSRRAGVGARHFKKKIVYNLELFHGSKKKAVFYGNIVGIEVIMVSDEV